MNYTIVYYTRDGSTGIAADYLADVTKGKKVQLEAGKYLNNFILGGFNSASKKLPKLKGDPWSGISDAEAVILASPVWAGNGNPAMNSFIDQADFSGKKVYILSLQADPGKKAQNSVLPLVAEAVKSHGGEVAGMLAIHGTSPGKRAEKDYIENQLKDWKLS
ncbi:flavodoxin family protein [Spirochaeta isovalerica]|uniref:Multimeric flavodoxin WrbA n=1 Tax=Spirochaeta isovalerica TaxID=150 RepID=A0A841RF23_9SPIO|nr:NAD(P)H-dependent oxidoreductase [Spirochaeta isovalerica]MBB6481198.1 multimeric flavodoxin WrbA [Spirochaeta isovalerica]